MIRFHFSLFLPVGSTKNKPPLVHVMRLVPDRQQALNNVVNYPGRHLVSLSHTELWANWDSVLESIFSHLIKSLTRTNILQGKQRLYLLREWTLYPKTQLQVFKPWYWIVITVYRSAVEMSEKFQSDFENSQNQISMLRDIARSDDKTVRLTNRCPGYDLWRIYRQVSNIRRILVASKIVDHSDVVGASPVGAAPTTYSFST